MSTKLLLIVSSLLMTMNCVNIGYTMEDDSNTFAQTQYKSVLDLKQQELNSKINEFSEKLMSNDEKKSSDEKKSFICRRILSSIREMKNSKKFDINSINNYSSFSELTQLFKTKSRINKRQKGQTISSRVLRQSLGNDALFFRSFVEIIKLMYQIEYLKDNTECINKSDDELIALISQDHAKKKEQMEEEKISEFQEDDVINKINNMNIDNDLGENKHEIEIEDKSWNNINIGNNLEKDIHKIRTIIDDESGNNIEIYDKSMNNTGVEEEKQFDPKDKKLKGKRTLIKRNKIKNDNEFKEESKEIK